MQLSRIKSMSEKRKMEWLQAIFELEKDYRNDMQATSDCPLCPLVETCQDCLWRIIEGCNCGAYHWNDHVGIPDRWRAYYGEWRTHRLKMLERWRMILKFSEEDFLNRFGATIKEVSKAFEALGKELVEDFKPLGEAIKKVNEALEKEEKRRKK